MVASEGGVLVLMVSSRVRLCLGGVDDLSELKDARVWVYSARQDTVIQPTTAHKAVEFYRHFTREENIRGMTLDRDLAVTSSEASKPSTPPRRRCHHLHDRPLYHPSLLPEFHHR